jgi:predicted MFS family arabinose efflux permease
MCPSFLRARALSMYLLVLQGGMAVGSTVWGGLATRAGVPTALLCSAAAMVVGLLAVRRHSLTSEQWELTPAVIRD